MKQTCLIENDSVVRISNYDDGSIIREVQGNVVRPRHEGDNTIIEKFTMDTLSYEHLETLTKPTDADLQDRITYWRAQP